MMNDDMMLVLTMTALASATVLDGSTSMVNLPPLSVFTVSCMVVIYIINRL